MLTLHGERVDRAKGVSTCLLVWGRDAGCDDSSLGSLFANLPRDSCRHVLPSAPSRSPGTHGLLGKVHKGVRAVASEHVPLVVACVDPAHAVVHREGVLV